jgi:hypothetical protein
MPSVPLDSGPPRILPFSTGSLTVDTSRSDDQSTVRSREESPRAFFTAALGRPEEKRMKRLIDVAEGFSAAKRLSDESNNPFCLKWPRISEPGPEVGSKAKSTPETFEVEIAHRLYRLKQIRQDIRRGDWNTGRLWLICLTHEVEHISRCEGIDAYTTRGVGRVSAAIKMVGKYLGPLNDYLKRSKNIFQIMKEGGPAAVLLDDGGRPASV